jgi:retinol-binding protein 3
MLRNLVCFLLVPLAMMAQTAIPDTPVGRTFTAWLSAMNSGDRQQIEAYFKKYQPAKMENLDRTVQLADMSGGFEVTGIGKSDALHLEFSLKERSGDTAASGSLDVVDGNPAMVAKMTIQAGSHAAPDLSGKGGVPRAIDAATRARVIDGAIEQLNEYYVFPEVAKKMEAAVRARQKNGEYDAITSGDQFAEMLTEHFREISHDKHLAVRYSAAALPAGGAEEHGGDQAEYRKQMERINCGFEKAERLMNNVGYLKFNMFADPNVCRATATAAMNFLGNVDSIVFDLRGNGGGDPAMVALISSYLFETRTHLNDLWTRKGNTTEEYWTQPDVPGKKLSAAKVFILTSSRTFSGAEEFTNNLKNLKRATVVGETTGGGAHPVSGHRIDEHFLIGVPFARAINPITKTNWEGTGVEPDVKVPAADALSAALKMAAKH